MRSEPITLGALIAGLEKCDPLECVHYDFARMVPYHVDSYRGYYEDLAISWHDDETAPRAKVQVTHLLAKLRDAVGKIFQGYKGGSYEMTPDTRVWAANWGECGSTAVVGVRRLSGGGAVLETAYVE